MTWKSDGCTLFPDKVLTAAGRLCCCWHDKGYAEGISILDRWWTDLDFFYCLKAAARGYLQDTNLEKQSFKRAAKYTWLTALAPTMWLGVRIGGMPIWWLRQLRRGHEKL